jgi:AcrR family transcriptional regulator
VHPPIQPHVESAPAKTKVQVALDARRDEILGIATRHFASNGFSNTDVQLVADEAGLGKGTIYRDFESKEGLFLAAGDRVMRLLDCAICEAIKGVTDPLDQIARAVIRYLSFFDDHPEFVELLILERAVFRDRKKPTYFEHREKNVGRWQELYRKLMKAGQVRQMPADVITDVLSSALYGTMFTNYMAGRHKSLERQARQVLDIVFDGILVQRSR